MDSRKLVYKKGPFVSDDKRFEESKNYKSPEYLLKSEEIYFKHNDKKLKSLEYFFCLSRNSIEYKNRFANTYVKKYLNETKKPQWLDFFNKPQVDQISEIDRQILQFNETIDNTITTNVNIAKNPNKYIVTMTKIIDGQPKSYIENIDFMFDKPLQMLTLYVLLQSDKNYMAPLKILKYELEVRVIIENFYNNNFESIKDIIRELYVIPSGVNLDNITKDNPGELCDALSMFEKYSTNITFWNGRIEDFFNDNKTFEDFINHIFNGYFANGNNVVPTGNRNFITGLLANQDVYYNYSNTTDYYLIFSDIDNSMNNLRLSDLIYFSYFFNGQKVGNNNIKEKIMGSILYGFCHEVGHEVDVCFAGVKQYQRRANLNGIVQNDQVVADINNYVSGGSAEATCDLFSYKLVYLLLDQLSTVYVVKKDIVKYLLFMTCGDKNSFGHTDTMIRSNYIRFLQDFDQYLPQDNSYYKKYLKYKSKYLALKSK